MSSDATPIRVLFVEDHQLLADALSLLLGREPDIEVIGVAGTVAQAKAMSDQRLDVVLMDYQLPDGTGAEATRAIKLRWPRARVVMVTALSDDETLLESIQAGADGYLTKDRAAEDVVQAVRAANAGETLLPRSVIVEIARRVATAKERGSDARSSNRSRRASSRCSERSRRAARRPRSASSCSSRRTRSGPTSRTSWASSACTRSWRRSRSPCATGWSNPRGPRTRCPPDGDDQRQVRWGSRGKRGSPNQELGRRRRVARRSASRRSPSPSGGPGSSPGFWRRLTDRRSKSRRSVSRNAPQRGQRRSSAKSDSSGETA